MTPLTKRRWSTRRQGKRRATIKLKLADLVPCPNCHLPIRSHIMCPHCKFYNGKKIV